MSTVQPPPFVEQERRPQLPQRTGNPRYWFFMFWATVPVCVCALITAAMLADRVRNTQRWEDSQEARTYRLVIQDQQVDLLAAYKFGEMGDEGLAQQMEARQLARREILAKSTSYFDYLEADKKARQQKQLDIRTDVAKRSIRNRLNN